jgi:hypothetical protein
MPEVPAPGRAAYRWRQEREQDDGEDQRAALQDSVTLIFIRVRPQLMPIR